MTENIKSYKKTNLFPNVTVIADDITGAAEIAGVCLRYGLDVSFSINSVPDVSSEILVIATDSRSLPGGEAMFIHKGITESILKKYPETRLFKKCDSALRGHILAELSVLSDVTGKDRVLLQPANPKTERYILNGMYIINDQLIEDTAFAHDPDFPAITSLVEMLLTSRWETKPNTKKIYTGKINRIDKPGIYVPDCSSIINMQQSLKLCNEETLMAGSAVFFERYLKHMGMISCQVKPSGFSIETNYLIISGSTHSESRQFRKKLEKLQCPVISLPDVLLSPEINENDLQKFADSACTIFKTHNKLCLTISNQNIEFDNCSVILKRHMSNIVNSILHNTEINELFIEGGATAYDILQVAEFKSFKPVTELAPGVVRMQSGETNNLFLTIKPGSYSWPVQLFQ